MPCIRGRDIFGGAGLDGKGPRACGLLRRRSDTAVNSNAKYPCDYPFLIGALSHHQSRGRQVLGQLRRGRGPVRHPTVIGENVGGGDNKTEFNPDGSIRALPDLDAIAV